MSEAIVVPDSSNGKPSQEDRVPASVTDPAYEALFQGIIDGGRPGRDAILARMEESQKLLDHGLMGG